MLAESQTFVFKYRVSIIYIAQIKTNSFCINSDGLKKTHLETLKYKSTVHVIVYFFLTFIEVLDWVYSVHTL